MTTDERMTKMEDQLARVRWFNRCLIACMVLSLGVWLILKTFRPETAWAQSGTKEIRANKFVLEDENGKPRAVQSVDKKGRAVLLLVDENNKPRAYLAAGTDGPGLALYDENGTARVGLAVSKVGPMLLLSDENGKPRAELATAQDGAGLILRDKNEKGLAIMTVLKGEPALGLKDENGKPIWSAP